MSKALILALPVLNGIAYTSGRFGVASTHAAAAEDVHWCLQFCGGPEWIPHLPDLA